MTRLVPFRFSVGAIHELTLLSMTPPFLDMGDAERCGEGMREAKTGRGWSDLPYSLSSIEIDSHTRSSRPKRLLKYVILPSPQYCGTPQKIGKCTRFLTRLATIPLVRQPPSETLPPDTAPLPLTGHVS